MPEAGDAACTTLVSLPLRFLSKALRSLVEGAWKSRYGWRSQRLPRRLQPPIETRLGTSGSGPADFQS